MPFALWSVLIAACLPLLWAVISKIGARRYDNHAPRAWLANLDGYRQRANWAQMNAWEAFSPYAAGMVLAWVRQVPATTLDLVAGVFIAARVLHGVLYLADKAAWRSLSWLIGFASVIALFVLAARV
ncbi:MAPEG family protein [Paludibacterium paludis]|uniref:MAPEG superfamily protein n=1 Tax=Paludibacterium paludis TaxID=1225769 RepID=A0A918P6M2_9NEIS|nr:MAPEG family protein [Paludibacterium paludis]GGY26534.1 hypothetical protein GCM10011289_32600 [Paludibacterium paludis]